MKIQDNTLLHNFLTRQRHLRLVSMSKDGYPDIRTVHFAHQDNTIYFISFANSNKILQIQENNNIAFSIENDKDPQSPYNIRGFGDVSFIEDKEQKQEVFERLTAKIPELKDFNFPLEEITTMSININTLFFQDFTKGMPPEKLVFN